jgi:hypothetical protein
MRGFTGSDQDSKNGCDVDVLQEVWIRRTGHVDTPAERTQRNSIAIQPKKSMYKSTPSAGWTPYDGWDYSMKVSMSSFVEHTHRSTSLD